MPSAEEQKNEIQKSAQVTLSTSLVVIIIIIINKTHQMSLVWGEGEKDNPHKQHPSHAIYACLFASLFPFPFVPFSPGSVRFDSFLMHIAMIVKLWNFQKK